jgi:hypothetical protein
MREVVEISNGSEPEMCDLIEENKRLVKEVEGVLDTVMARTREVGVGQLSIDEYLERTDGNERVREMRSSGICTSTSRVD